MNSLQSELRPRFSTAMLDYGQVWWTKGDRNKVGKYGPCPFWDLECLNLGSNAADLYLVKNYA